MSIAPDLIPHPRDHPSLHCDAPGCEDGQVPSYCCQAQELGAPPPWHCRCLHKYSGWEPCESCEGRGYMDGWTCQECGDDLDACMYVPDPALYDAEYIRVCSRCAAARRESA